MSLSESQLQEIKQQFEKYDLDKSNTIDHHELKKLLEETLKTKLSDNLFNRYVSTQFDKSDKNKDGKIQFDEFVQFYKALYFSNELPISMGVKQMEKRSYVERPNDNAPKVNKNQIQLSESEVELAKIKFNEYDLDKSGSIDKQELRKLLEDVNGSKKMSKLLFDRLVDMHMQQGDKDGNEKIEFEEFLGIYTKIFGTQQK
ncbi:hypothetical protein ABK040_003588 [Willaertia magna]